MGILREPNGLTLVPVSACDTISSSGNAVSELLTLLMGVQSAALASFGGGPEFDPKYYVDLPLRFSLNSTKNAFSSLARSPGGIISSDTLKNFLKEYFDDPGSDLLPYTPCDYNPNPLNFLDRLQNADARTWALRVHSLWLSLARQVAPSVEREPEQHTLLPLVHPFVVPGERFREVYYWDSYWVIRGLLVSKMLKTATGMVENLLILVETYGFVPNGARTYYQNRSQPPFLSMMVRAIFAEASDLTLVKRALPVLIREHEFWTQEPHEVLLQDGKGTEHRLGRYYANWDTPRPECSTIDKSVAEGMSKSKQTQLYHDIATAAESGWDFSSRWMDRQEAIPSLVEYLDIHHSGQRKGNQQSLSSLRTSSIVPVDLNSFLLQMELDIAFLARAVGNTTAERHFIVAANARRSAIGAILWNDGMGQWLDYWLPVDTPEKALISGQKKIHILDRSNSNRQIIASNFIPLWCGVLLPGYPDVERVVEALRSSGLIHKAGIATSVKETGQQWDFPNAWAPLQHMIIDGLASSGSLKGKQMAADIARSWLKSNYAAFEAIGHMIEKYDARYCGKVGGGGEYETQSGFGWTNGVVLVLLHDYGWPKDKQLDCDHTFAPCCAS